MTNSVVLVAVSAMFRDNPSELRVSRRSPIDFFFFTLHALKTVSIESRAAHLRCIETAWHYTQKKTEQLNYRERKKRVSVPSTTQSPAIDAKIELQNCTEREKRNKKTEKISTVAQRNSSVRELIFLNEREVHARYREMKKKKYFIFCSSRRAAFFFRKVDSFKRPIVSFFFLFFSLSYQNNTRQESSKRAPKLNGWNVSEAEWKHF